MNEENNNEPTNPIASTGDYCEITINCPVCSKEITAVKQLVKEYGKPVCRECSEEWERKHSSAANRAEQLEQDWRHKVGAEYAELDEQNPQYAEAMAKLINAASMKQPESLFVLGPTGSCKTRIMCEYLKGWHLRNRDVDIMWSLDLKETASMSGSRKFTQIRRYAEVGVLGMDDPFFTAVHDDRVVDMIKETIDMRLRERLPTVITSQLGSREIIQAAHKWAERESTTQAIQALLRRLYEVCTPVKLGE